MSPTQFLLNYARKHPFWITLTIVLGWSGALFNGVSMTLIVPVILAFLGQEVEFQQGPPIVTRAFSLLEQVSPRYQLGLMMGVILLLIVLKNVTLVSNQLASAHLSRLLVKDIRLNAVQLLLDIDIDYYSKKKLGDILNYVNQEVGRCSSAIRIGIRTLTNAMTVLIFVGILILISWQLTLVSTLLLMLVPLLSQFIIRRSQEYGKILSEKSRAYTTALMEVLNGIRLVKSTGQENQEYFKIKRLIEDREKAEMQSQVNYSIITPMNELSGLFVILCIIIIGRIIFSNQIESLSTLLLTYLFVLSRVVPLMGQLNNSRSEFANVIPSTIIVSEFLRKDDKPLMKDGTEPYRKLENGIHFDHLSFSYSGHKDVVLKDVDLWLPKGTTLALVGGSGAGKSTLADLLPRFYDTTEGRITIDGKDLREFDMRSLRKSMGIVSQDTFLFNDSVRNNIAYGRPDVTEQEVIEAAKLANAYEFIMNLPEGFDTPLGDRGILLSGGQRQRIAIARALLHNPDILILDEATSALDTVSEHLVQQAIERLSRDRTTLVIAHRLSTVKNADQIAVLDKGQVVETGTHEELLSKGGYYAKLYSMQFSLDTQDLVKKARSETLMNTSYEIRTRLNPMIGFLRLIVDDVVDSPQELRELTQESYESAIRLLNTLEYMEKQSKLEV
ncbi:ATP-binding cassette domain-containing protein [Laspinema olomoucense]|uniref:ATP-binding cassette domain-containing protein n=1 Tax=Laspinema olomoucense TaxID=3231600 RepID=UPI0021BBA88E|nr:ATP-binding cassette domain-containing protein [Laspinema sp. D3c]MCT7994492.1 ATP-binding cassette domain-containing protein [Laspinema sp. D3c]